MNPESVTIHFREQYTGEGSSLNNDVYSIESDYIVMLW